MVKQLVMVPDVLHSHTHVLTEYRSRQSWFYQPVHDALLPYKRRRALHPVEALQASDLRLTISETK